MNDEIQRQLNALASRVLELERRENPIIVARASTSAGHTFLTATPARVDYDIVDFDPRGCITTGLTTWVFTAPVGGYYWCYHFNLFTAGSLNDAQAYNSYLYKNAGVYCRLDRLEAQVTGSMYGMLKGGSGIELASGDTVSFWLQQVTGGDLALQADAQLNYCFVGKWVS